jgi:hypothetical protein
MKSCPRRFVWFPVLVVAACGGEPAGEDPAAAGPAAAAAAPAVAKLVLPASPAGAVSVLDAKAAGPKEQGVVTGRVAYVVPGYAAFTLMDLSLPYCGEKNKEDGCKSPWDYCCETKDTRTEHALVVEARGEDGKPLATPVLPDLRLLDRVTVAGRLVKDEHGNHVLLATGWHRDERPQLGADVRWPEAR